MKADYVFVALAVSLFFFVTVSSSFAKDFSVSTASVSSFTFNNLTTIELETVRDSNFRHFIKALADVEDNYRRAGTLNTKKIFISALKGILEYGTGDDYAEFVPEDENDKHTDRKIKGIKTTKDGEVIEKVTVDSKIIEENLAYISITEFRESTIGQFDKAMTKILISKPDGMIIDLRDNSGGMINVVSDMLLYLVPPETTVVRFHEYSKLPYSENAESDDEYRKEKNILPLKGIEFFRQIPLVILINRSTASASEIMAGALRDLGRAKLIGEKSFGKGVYQTEIQSFFGRSWITAGGWFTPRGISVSGKGLKPDFKVDHKRAMAEAIRVLRLEINVGIR